QYHYVKRRCIMFSFFRCESIKWLIYSSHLRNWKHRKSTPGKGYSAHLTSCKNSFHSFTSSGKHE
ncbi:14921_t:CDS:2, partial [Dentiscutata heterogama]